MGPRLGAFAAPLLSIGLLIGSTACGSLDEASSPGGALACTEEARAGLNVTVRSTAGTRVCSATVTAVDGDYSEKLKQFGVGEDCSYAGAFGRSGDYQINAAAPSYVTASVDAVVTEGACRVIPVSVEITLEREGEE